MQMTSQLAHSWARDCEEQGEDGSALDPEQAHLSSSTSTSDHIHAAGNRCALWSPGAKARMVPKVICSIYCTVPHIRIIAKMPAGRGRRILHLLFEAGFNHFILREG
ncbi:hypothetical protein SKAU_G00198440 [Synaphobranchus kaupii]|uniref:Uncharacterized protein n=1 Tax=Synaphobranchus kaupii TaxID=118154 RepID=A0A9Q1FFC4_SYNKA|nr:hypothetical protein SKAU_G00198440 [Synaphobranchus kaupii]